MRDFMELPAFSLRPEEDDSTATVAFDLRGEEPGGENEAGHRIGPYRIVRLLGQGGMGAVHLAERVDEFEQQVAIKVLAGEVNTEAVVRSFHRERQVLARLEHPNIAKLLDGGTTDDGAPYFVMEYVEGEPIDRYCERHALSVSQRLELFRKVCSAVHRAHQSLVVHRDLKPGNILVGADGEPKLLDFGIAKPLDADGASASVLTAFGIQPMTLAYASPEQINNEAITTASDVYSLGVVLYELLTGCPPYRAAGYAKGPPESPLRPLDLADAVRNQQPYRPSSAVARADAPGLSSRGLRRRLAGDLDSIVLMALAKLPEDRYPSVEQLSADIERHLDGLPVTARKLSFTYWMGKFVRRHTLETVLAALVLTAIVGFSLVAVHLKNQAESEKERAEVFASTLVELFKAPDPGRAQGKDVTAREILDRGKERISARRGSNPRLHARLAATMVEVYYSLGLYPDAQEMLEGALADLRSFSDREADVERADLSNDLAIVLWAQGHLAEAEKRLGETLALKVRLYGKDAPTIVETLNNLATMAVQRGDFAAAEGHYQRGLRIRQTQSPPVASDVAKSHSLLGYLLLEREAYEAAEGHLRKALALRRGLAEPEPTDIALVLGNLGLVLQGQGKAADSEAVYREALEIRRRVLDPGHPDVAITETHLASLLESLGQFAEAERLSLRAAESLRHSKPGHWRIAHAESVLGSALAGSGRLEEAEQLLLDSYPKLATWRECGRQTKDALRRLVELYGRQGLEAKQSEYRRRLESCPVSQG